MLKACKQWSWFDWLIVLGSVFLVSATALKLFFPGMLKKMIRDYPTPRHTEITVALDPRYEWLRDSIAQGDNVFDSLEQKVWAEVLSVQTAPDGPLKGRTLVRLKVLVMQGDSGLTVYSRYKIRKGERYVFECPLYIFESVIVGWKALP